jgi:hypothetical protein
MVYYLFDNLFCQWKLGYGFDKKYCTYGSGTLVFFSYKFKKRFIIVKRLQAKQPP